MESPSPQTFICLMDRGLSLFLCVERPITAHAHLTLLSPIYPEDTDCRGKFESDGEFTPIVDDERDGIDMLNWLANQKWCDGNIGLVGGSYGGVVQIPVAASGHEALKCFAPGLNPTSYFFEWIRYGGCFALALNMRWGFSNASCRSAVNLDHVDWQKLFEMKSFDEVEAYVGLKNRVIREWIIHDRHDEYWDKIDQTRMYHKIKIPAFHTGGWFDQFVRGTVDAYCGIRKQGSTELAREGQRLRVGPYGHGMSTSLSQPGGKYGTWCFGPAASKPFPQSAFFDYYLKGIDNGYTREPKVEVFLMGENRWLELEDWPPPQTSYQKWYLHSDGKVNSNKDGRLDLRPAGREVEDRYIYDPEDPVPSRGGALWRNESEFLGPQDQRPLLNRSDICLYRSKLLDAPLSIVGPIKLDIYITSSALDTDFTAKLCLEEESGAIICITTGCIRCRFRNSWSQPEPLIPGEPAKIIIDLGNIALTFAKGTRICLMVSSSDFPHIQPNSNTMALPFGEQNPIVAKNAVLHGGGYPSCVVLPIFDL